MNQLYGISFATWEFTLHWNRRFITLYLIGKRVRSLTHFIGCRVPDAEQCEYELTHGFNPLNNFFGYIRN